VKKPRIETELRLDDEVVRVRLANLGPTSDGRIPFGDSSPSLSTRRWIRIDPRWPVAETQDTLLHELLHICHRKAGVRYSKAEEAAVNRLTPWLLAALQQNPWLIEYLAYDPR
jgi:hypothetical protein